MKRLVIGFVIGFLVAYQMRKERVQSGIVYFPSNNPADYILW